jgi:colanic acid/amylovoran biosynthesis glycosyltransferase
MKIAYFINQYPKVSHSFIRREILALENQGFEVLRIALRGWNEPHLDPDDRSEQLRTRYVLQSGILPLLLPTLRALLSSPVRLMKAGWLAIRIYRESERGLLHHLVCVAEACRVLSWITDHGCLRLHAHFGTNSAEVAMLTRTLGGPPYSFTAHGPEEFEKTMGLGEKIHRAAFTVAISSFGRSQLYLRSRYRDWPKIHVIHCGLERSFYDVPTSPPSARPRLICVGRLCEAKGQLLLIEAIARLVASGVQIELVLAGDGPVRPQIEGLIERHDLAASVRITGWISSSMVRAEILAARALVLPSFAEGLPVVLMEAMALRRPILSTYVAGIPELVIPGENGWLFAAGSVEELAAAMISCLSKTPEQLSKMGDAGYERVIERHSIEREAGKLARLFRAATSPAT